jgi:hypothetical protein
MSSSALGFLNHLVNHLIATKSTRCLRALHQVDSASMAERELDSQTLRAALPMLRREASEADPRDPQGRFKVVERLAKAYRMLGDSRAELQVLATELWPVMEQLGDLKRQAAILWHIASLHAKCGDPEITLLICEHELLPLTDRLGLHVDKANAYGLIVDVHLKRHRSDLAMQVLTEQFLPFAETSGDPVMRALALERLARMHYHQRDLAVALRMLREDVLPIYAAAGERELENATRDKIEHLSAELASS